MALLLDDPAVVQRLLDHIEAGTTDLSDGTWREPVANYRSAARLAAEMEVLRRHPVPLCPSAALPEAGSYVARDAAGTPLLAVRGRDGAVRVFRNACRHRGAQVAGGAGCERAFVCPYHGWTYGLDGSLRHLPHAHGFPPPAGDDGEADRALVRVATAERHGFVVVDQHAPPAEPLRLDGPWDEVAGVVAPDHRLEGSSTSEEPVNWKLMAETFLEGLHIRFLHRETFFPLQYDNVTVVEDFGPHSRVAFPYRALARLADVPPAERTVDGRLTYVYHLFPNVMVATFPGRRVLVVGLEPLAVDRTRVHIDGLVADRPVVSPPGGRREGGDGEDRRGGGGPDLVARGGAEDFTVARSVQRGLAAGANTHLEFGLFEGAIAHFHRTLDAALADLPAGAAP